MKYIKFLLPIIALCVAGPGYAAHTSVPFMNSTVEILDSAEAAGVIGKDDGYPAKFSTFDAEGRMGKGASYKEYLPFAMKNTKNWTGEEEEQLKASFAEIAKYFTGEAIKLNLPATIYLIKSNTKEEFGAEGYTRSNMIVLNTAVEGVNPHLAAHELFHVYSRHNEKMRDALYGVFNFKKCNPIALTVPLKNKNITNPDCPVVSHYVTANGQDMTLVLYSERDYDGGNVFQSYVKIGVLMLQGDATHKQAKLTDGKAQIKALENTPELFQQIGSNTAYVLHPEEICAEHFAMLVTGKQPKQPEYLVKFKETLKK